MTRRMSEHRRQPQASPAEAWHLDSSLPAADSLSDLPEPEPLELPEPIEEPDPLPFDEAPTELPGVAMPFVPSRRSKTIARKQMLRERRRLIAEGRLPEVLDYERPVTRAECRGGDRPCLYVACRYHLYLDVNPRTGSIKINFPELEAWQLPETCALDVAERGGVTLEEVGDIMNLTRERIRQVEGDGLSKLRDDEGELEVFLEGEEKLVDARRLIDED